MDPLDTVTYLVSQITSSPVDIKSTTQDNHLEITLSTTEEETGQLIGRNGAIINSIRRLAYLAHPEASFSIKVTSQKDQPDQTL